MTYLPSQDKECEEEDEEGDSSHEFGLLQHPWPEEATDQGCPLPCPLHDGFPLPPVPMEPSAFLPLCLWEVQVSGMRTALPCPISPCPRGPGHLCPITVRTWSLRGRDRGGQRGNPTARRANAGRGSRRPPATAGAAAASVQSSCAERGSRRGNPAHSSAWSTVGPGRAGQEVEHVLQAGVGNA